MNNNVWKTDITELFKNIQDAQNSNNDNSQYFNKKNLNDKRYKKVRFSKFHSKFSKLRIKMLADEDKANELTINSNNNTDLTKKDLVIQSKLNLLHNRSNHRGISLLIDNVNKDKFKYEDIADRKLSMTKHYPEATCNSCAKAKSTKIPRLSKERKVTTMKIGEP